ncbi:MAG: helix-turn-helix domain-containing protein [Candidatus Acidiferrales bacterium]
MPNLSNKKLRDLLAEARKAANLTQAELAERLNRPQSFVSKYERGERRLDVVEFGEVARAIGLDPVRLLKNFYREGS